MAFSEEAYQQQVAGSGLKSGNYGLHGTTTSSAVAGAARPITAAPTPKPNVPGFVKRVAGQTLDIGKTLGGAAARFVGNTAVDIGRTALHTAATLTIDPAIARARQQNVSRQMRELDVKQRQVTSAYKSGKMTKDNYTKSLKELSHAYDGLSHDSQKLIKEADPAKRAKEVVETGINILAGGTAGLVKATGKEAGKEVFNGLISKSIKGIEEAVAKVPAARELMERNAQKVVTREGQKLAGESTEQWLAREGKQIAVGLLIKRPLFYQQNVGYAQDIYQHVIEHEKGSPAGSAAWMAAQMVGGGPIGYFLNRGKGVLGHLGSLARGRASFIDEVSSRIGKGDRGAIAKYIEDSKKASIPVEPIDPLAALKQEALKYKSADEFSKVMKSKVEAPGFSETSPNKLVGNHELSVIPTYKIGFGASPDAQESVATALKGIKSGKQLPPITVKEEIANTGPLGAPEKTYTVIDGNHRLQAYKQAGVSNVPVLIKRSDGGNSITNLTDLYNQAHAEIQQLTRNKFTREFGDTVAQPTQGAKTAVDAERTFRILQETNLRAADGKVETAADNVLNHYIQHGVDLKTITPEQLATDMGNWAKADELAQKTIKQGVIKGVPPEDVGKYAVVRWDRTTQNALANAIENTGNAQDRLNVLNDFADRAGVGWSNNEILMNKLYKIIGEAQSGQSAAEAIKGISTASTLLKGVPKTVREELSKLGYTIAAPFGGNKIARINYDDVENLPKLVSGTIKGTNDLFDPAHSPEPVMSSIANGLQKAGLSPESANTVAHQKLSESLVGNLGELGIARNLGFQSEGDIVKGGRVLLSELQRYVENKQGARIVNKISSGRSAVTDIRQLTNREIAQALRISDSEAKDVSRAIRKAYTDVPLEFRGLGDKAVDYAIAAPFSPMRYYLRAQSALRYTYNPFFRFQERFETAALAKMDADKFIWLTPPSQLRATVKELETNNFFSGNVFGSGADDNVIGRISANLTYAQKRNLAGLATTIAESQGKTVTQLIQDSPEQLDDALRVIVQYPRKGALSSPLARTLNIAFFPMRYNAKVSLLVAEKLATAPPSVQLAMLQGIHKMRGWLKSDEGIQWQADHAEAIKVFAWASPIGNIQALGKLLSGSVDSWGDMGLMGGLPFGFISQILDAEGIINLNKPYVNPSTGDVLPDYIPQTTKAQAATALQTLLGTMFSFPGRTLGLPGKEATIRDFVDQFINTNGKDFDKHVNTDQLTPLQQKVVKVLKGDTSKETLDSLYTSPAPGQFNYYTLPPMTLPYTVRGINQPNTFTKREGLPSLPKKSRSSGKKPKPLPTPIPTR